MDGMEIGFTSGFYIHRAEGAVDLKRFSIRPAIGYFLSDRLELRVGYDYEEIKRDRDVTRTHVMLIGPIWYVPVADRVTGYFQADIGSSQSMIRQGGSEAEDRGLTMDLGMGTQIFLNEIIAVDLGIRWMRINEMSDRDRIDLYVGTSFFLK